MLQRGARSVLAIDTGYGQIAEKLRRDERVSLMERTNARLLGAGFAGWAAGIGFFGHGCFVYFGDAGAAGCGEGALRRRMRRYGRGRRWCW